MRSSTLISHSGSDTPLARPVISKARSRVRSSAAWLRRESSSRMQFAQRTAGFRQQAQDLDALVDRAERARPGQCLFQVPLGRAQGLQPAVAARHLRQCQAHLQWMLVAFGLVQRGRGLAQRACVRGCRASPGLRASGHASALRGLSLCIIARSLGCSVAPSGTPRPCYAGRCGKASPEVGGTRCRATVTQASRAARGVTRHHGAAPEENHKRR